MNCSRKIRPPPRLELAIWTLAANGAGGPAVMEKSYRSVAEPTTCADLAVNTTPAVNEITTVTLPLNVAPWSAAYASGDVPGGNVRVSLIGNVKDRDEGFGFARNDARIVFRFASLFNTALAVAVATVSDAAVELS